MSEVLLLNQVCSPNIQLAKCWDAEVCSKESLFMSQPSEEMENRSQISLLEGKGLEIFMG